MAATTATDYSLIAATVQGFLEAALPENFTLFTSGAITLDTRPSLALQVLGGNSVVSRGYFRNQTTWQTPTADTDLTINALDTYNNTLPVFRRAQNFGIEDAAKLASGDSNAEMHLNEALRYNYTYNLEALIAGALKGWFNDTGCLYDTHTLKNSGVSFATSMIEEALIPLGDIPESDMVILTHPTMYRKTVMTKIAEGKTDDLDSMYNTTGTLFGGTIGGKPVFLNARLTANTNGSYNVYIIQRGALQWIVQQDFNVQAGYEPRLAAGTSYVQFVVSAAVGLNGVNFSGTTGTAIGGVTDAAIQLATNWAKQTTVDSATFDDSMYRAVCIQAEAG